MKHFRQLWHFPLRLMPIRGQLFVSKIDGSEIQ